jgi:PilZ domain
MATSDRRNGARVAFEKGIEISIMGIDGTWRRDCIMLDVSQTGARLTIQDSIEGLKIKEFFLLLSGLTYRRCELAWVNGEEIGARFVTAEKKKQTGRSHNNNSDAPQRVVVPNTADK